MQSVHSGENAQSGTPSGTGSGGDFRPDFRHVKSWIFDLDNTLYRADNGIFAQIEAKTAGSPDRLLLRLPD